MAPDTKIVEFEGAPAIVVGAARQSDGGNDVFHDPIEGGARRSDWGRTKCGGLTGIRKICEKQKGRKHRRTDLASFQNSQRLYAYVSFLFVFHHFHFFTYLGPLAIPLLPLLEAGLVLGRRNRSASLQPGETAASF